MSFVSIMVFTLIVGHCNLENNVILNVKINSEVLFHMPKCMHVQLILVLFILDD